MHWRGPDFIGPVSVSPPDVHATAGISRHQYLSAIVLTASKGALSVHAERRSHRRRSALLPCRTRKADYENLLLTLIKVGPDACQMFALGRCLLPLINRATFGIHSC